MLTARAPSTDWEYEYTHERFSVSKGFAISPDPLRPNFFFANFPAQRETKLRLGVRVGEIDMEVPTEDGSVPPSLAFFERVCLFLCAREGVSFVSSSFTWVFLP